MNNPQVNEEKKHFSVGQGSTEQFFDESKAKASSNNIMDRALQKTIYLFKVLLKNQ